MLILIGGEKGGPGKTTAATNLIGMHITKQKNSNDHLLYDLDPQRTSTLWASRRDEYNISPRVASTQKILDERILNKGMVIRNELLGLMDKYKTIIVDAGGADNEMLRAGLLLADFFLIPLLPSSFDIWTMGKINTLIGEAKQTNKKLVSKVWFNKVPPQPNAAETDIQESTEELSDFENLEICKSHMVFRQVVKKAQKFGQIITEYKPADKKAIEEITSLYEEVFND